MSVRYNRVMLTSRFAHIGVIVAVAAIACPLSWAVVTFASHGDFLQAATISNIETFNSFTEHAPSDPFSTNGIMFTTLTGGHALHSPYITAPNTLGNAYQPDSMLLDANGDENFRIELENDAPFIAIGFNVVTNAFGAPVLSLFDAGNSLIGSWQLTQSPNSHGFFGAVSTTPIAYATFIVDRGWMENVGLDNVQIGEASVPEPAAGGLLALGLGAFWYARRKHFRTRLF